MERGRERERETERQRDRETERQRDRETERQRDRDRETSFGGIQAAAKALHSFSSRGEHCARAELVSEEEGLQPFRGLGMRLGIPLY